jgi:hypothetical protein
VGPSGAEDELRLLERDEDDVGRPCGGGHLAGVALEGGAVVDGERDEGALLARGPGREPRRRGRRGRDRERDPREVQRVEPVEEGTGDVAGGEAAAGRAAAVVVESGSRPRAAR